MDGHLLHVQAPGSAEALPPRRHVGTSHAVTEEIDDVLGAPVAGMGPAGVAMATELTRMAPTARLEARSAFSSCCSQVSWGEVRLHLKDAMEAARSLPDRLVNDT